MSAWTALVSLKAMQASTDARALTNAGGDLGQITVWVQVDDLDVVFDVLGVVSGVILDVNDVSDANVGLESGRFGVSDVVSDVNDVSGVVFNVSDVILGVLTSGRFGVAGRFGRFGQVVDLGQITVWGQGSDMGGFGHSLHKQFPQLLSGKGSCFGVSCIFFGVLLPDPILALLDLQELLQELLLSPPLGLEEFFIMPLLGCVELDLELLTGFDQCFNCSLVLPDGLSVG